MCVNGFHMPHMVVSWGTNKGCCDGKQLMVMLWCVADSDVGAAE